MVGIHEWLTSRHAKLVVNLDAIASSIKRAAVKELDFQTIIRKAIEGRGGYGLKLSNRFLVGVPDLLLHLPGQPTMVVEAKFDRVASMTRAHTISLTPKQAFTLRRMSSAGMVAGAISLLQCGNRYGVKVAHIDEFGGEDHLRVHGLAYLWVERRLLPETIVSDLQSRLGVKPCLRELPATDGLSSLYSTGIPGAKPRAKKTPPIRRT